MMYTKDRRGGRTAEEQGDGRWRQGRNNCKSKVDGPHKEGAACPPPVTEVVVMVVVEVVVMVVVEVVVVVVMAPTQPVSTIALACECV
jgi:hypothetical protein